MKKIINKTMCRVFALITLVSTVSCKDFLDINTSPLTATKVDTKLLFGYAVTAWDVNKNSGDVWIPIGLMTQNFASGGNFGWGKSNVYDISVYALGNTWKVYYSTAGNNLKQAITIAESSTPVNNNAAAQCKIVLAQFMYEATTLYGDVPFSEAWNAEQFPAPKFDKQKDVFNGIIAMLDEAIAQIDESSSLKITDYDIYYEGDMLKWKKIANSIKFKTLMTMVDADESVKPKIAQLLAAENTMINAAADSWLHKYSELENNENPKFRLLKTYTNSNNIWFFASKNVFSYMDPADPRIPKFFEKGSDGDYQAVETEVDATSKTSLLSKYLMRKNAPSLLLTYQELSLLKAEAYARGLGVAVDLNKANQLFKEGVKASMNFYEANPTDVDNFIANKLPNLTTDANPVKQIHLQQWIDLMDRSMEAFVQWRRSGPEGDEVPILSVPSGATQGPLIRRWTVSPEEISTNPNIPSPLPTYYNKMWFDL